LIILPQRLYVNSYQQTVISYQEKWTYKNYNEKAQKKSRRGLSGGSYMIKGDEVFITLSDSKVSI
jgi:hypothetical protein